MDSLDVNILKILNQDARTSFSEIARRLGHSITTISQRVKAMEDNGIIKKYATVLDPEKCGYDFTAIIHLIISKGELKEVEDKIKLEKNVVAVYDVTGSHDAIVIGRFKSPLHLEKFINWIQSIDYVESVSTSIVLNIIKEDMEVKFD
ncbi:MAG: putative HTH-type transcriptional regulator [Candidatus Methanofastidiosum methylothiophilum]|jgi:DNA-binding Lrp family transcriptional regulator|nr:MAG: putative HTH-type transcriptional regulator [Candidatus Methanofastidiosum methylthiophilus]HNZ59908.1 Lrp/AsnC family transcriptional regulator [Methanofastidiosum sp.]HOT85703.1 Lrp/AsnC family transcriptional regulator [Methanofastidiosum sp.]HPX23758.1 Lrp/AsnC family transcriptional regulator [Methanofastidiosum sp.]HQC24677.1 Lrp/AsnC family transcriptional regulator [Methanofastidiosum sp.]